MVEKKDNDSEYTKVGDVAEPYQRYGIRHLQMAAMTFTVISLFIARSSMGVAVLAMSGSGKSHENNTNVAVYDWDKKTQSLILSSFFWGYMTMQIPAGVLAKKFGGKIIILVALIVNCILCSLLPTLAALGGWQLVCAARVAMGLSQACLFPASITLYGQWLPPKERTSFTGIVNGGVQVGTIIAMPVSGLLAETALGWKSIFYAMSGLLFVTAITWYFCAGSSPRDHRLISKAELEYIETSLNSTAASRSMAVPWKKILTCLPVYALILTHIGNMMGFVLFFVDLPTYLEKGLKISLKNITLSTCAVLLLNKMFQSAFLSALPYAGMWVGNMVSSILAEKLINRKIMSVEVSRKVFNSISFFGFSLGLVALSLVGPDSKNFAIVALVTTLTFSGFCIAGYMVNFLDISPNFAGILHSVANCLANMGSVLMPIITSFILRNDSTDVSRWRVVFLMTAALSAAANVIYIIFGSTTRQAWNDPDPCESNGVDPEEVKPVFTSQEEKKELETEKTNTQ